MSPNKGRRSATSRRGGGGASGRPVDPAARRRLALLVFGAVFVVLFVIVAIAEGIGDPSIPSGDVAVVQDAPGDLGSISEAEFKRSLVQTAAQGGLKKIPKPGEEKYDELKESALGSILDMVWITGEAEEMGVEVTDAEVAKEFEKLKKQNFKTEAEYKKFLKQSKFTQADVDQRVKIQIIGTQIQKEITEDTPTPSKSEIENYYAAAKSTQFTQPETRDVRLVVNKKKEEIEAAKAALEEDDSAASWNKVAKKYSEDTISKDKGGLQKGLSEAAFETPLGEEVFAAPEGKLEGPVKTTRGYNIYVVEGTTPERVQQLGDVEDQIKSQLEQQAQQEAFSRFVANYGSKWKSRTFCADDYTIERCANFKPKAHPATAPPGCFDENAKGGLPEACPAPVFQLIPALPGSVTPVEPRGRPFAQRPRPAEGEETTEAPGSFELPTSP